MHDKPMKKLRKQKRVRCRWSHQDEQKARYFNTLSVFDDCAGYVTYPGKFANILHCRFQNRWLTSGYSSYHGNLLSEHNLLWHRLCSEYVFLDKLLSTACSFNHNPMDVKTNYTRLFLPWECDKSTYLCLILMIFYKERYHFTKDL